MEAAIYVSQSRGVGVEAPATQPGRRVCASNAQTSAEHWRHLSPFHLLVDIASRMPMEPLPTISEPANRKAAGDAMALPRIHDLLSDLPLARKRSWGESVGSASDSVDEDGGSRDHGSESPPSGPSPHQWPLPAKVNVQNKPPIPLWPGHPAKLAKGVNDTWNSFQRANKGRSVTTAEWKAARAQLWTEHDALLRARDAAPGTNFRQI